MTLVNAAAGNKAQVQPSLLVSPELLVAMASNPIAIASTYCSSVLVPS